MPGMVEGQWDHERLSKSQQETHENYELQVQDIYELGPPRKGQRVFPVGEVAGEQGAELEESRVWAGHYMEQSHGAVVSRG